MAFETCPNETALLLYAKEEHPSNTQRKKVFNHLQRCGLCRIQVKSLKDAISPAVAGLIDEIRRSRINISTPTGRLLNAVEAKIRIGARITPAECSKIEGIYAACRD